MEDRNNSTLEQVLAVTVKPGSRKGPLVETGDDGALTIYVPERAIEGKATAAAARLLPRIWAFPGAGSNWFAGATSRVKRFRIG